VHGVKILHYIIDRGACSTEEFQQDCLRISQTFDFSGVGDNHQNGVAFFQIEKVKIETKNQLADILMKGLQTEQFKHICDRLMSWLSASCLRGSLRIIS